MTPSRLYLVGCSHRTAPLVVRERIALSPESQKLLYERLQASSAVRECFILNTCNRLEIYGVGGTGTSHILRTALAEITHLNDAEIAGHSYEKAGVDVVGHLYEVAAGLDSQLVGETEIFGQVKAAYEMAKAIGSVGRVLHRVLQRTFQAGKWARTHTAIGQGQVSLGNVSVELAERVFGSLRKASALVVGSGDIGREVAKALCSRGLNDLSVTSRSFERALALAEEVNGATTLPFAEWTRALPHTDVAIFATAAPQVLLDVTTAEQVMRERSGRPLFLIDLAMPRDVDPAVGSVASAFLYNLDDLTEIANANRKLRESEMEKCRLSLRERAEANWPRLQPRG